MAESSEAKTPLVDPKDDVNVKEKLVDPNDDVNVKEKPKAAEPVEPAEPAEPLKEVTIWDTFRGGITSTPV